MKVYTKGGDKGETGLVSGTRVSKANQRIDLYGEVDELNSVIGVAISSLGKLTEHKELFLQIQSSLFDLGSNLACEQPLQKKFNLPQIPSSFIRDIEKTIDSISEKLPKLKTFILPGGLLVASQLHVARSVCRRVERKLVAYQSIEAIPSCSLEFLNRLSDFLFMYARYANFLEKIEENAWKGKTSAD